MDPAIPELPIEVIINHIVPYVPRDTLFVSKVTHFHSKNELLKPYRLHQLRPRTNDGVRTTQLYGLSTIIHKFVPHLVSACYSRDWYSCRKIISYMIKDNVSEFNIFLLLAMELTRLQGNNIIESFNKIGDLGSNLHTTSTTSIMYGLTRTIYRNVGVFDMMKRLNTILQIVQDRDLIYHIDTNIDNFCDATSREQCCRAFKALPIPTDVISYCVSGDLYRYRGCFIEHIPLQRLRDYTIMVLNGVQPNNYKVISYALDVIHDIDWRGLWNNLSTIHDLACKFLSTFGDRLWEVARPDDLYNWFGNMIRITPPKEVVKFLFRKDLEAFITLLPKLLDINHIPSIVFEDSDYDDALKCISVPVLVTSIINIEDIELFRSSIVKHLHKLPPNILDIVATSKHLSQLLLVMSSIPDEYKLSKQILTVLQYTSPHVYPLIPVERII